MKLMGVCFAVHYKVCEDVSTHEDCVGQTKPSLVNRDYSKLP